MMNQPARSNEAKQVETLDYFSGVRSEVLPLLPFEKGRILEIGCGSGATLNYLKDHHKISWAGGAEYSPLAANEARKTLDQVWEGDVEKIDLEADIAAGSLDAVLCMDVLEHLVDPWAVVERLHKLLKPGGVLISNLPNIRHHKIVWALLFKGQWKYEESGILDRTHLRFFVKETMIDLMECSGLHCDHVEAVPALKPWKNKWIYSKLTFGFMEDLYPAGYLLRAVRKD